MPQRDLYSAYDDDATQYGRGNYGARRSGNRDSQERRSGAQDSRDTQGRDVETSSSRMPTSRLRLSRELMSASQPHSPETMTPRERVQSAQASRERQPYGQASYQRGSRVQIPHARQYMRSETPMDDDVPSSASQRSQRTSVDRYRDRSRYTRRASDDRSDAGRADSRLDGRPDGRRESIRLDGSRDSVRLDGRRDSIRLGEGRSDNRSGGSHTRRDATTASTASTRRSAASADANREPDATNTRRGERASGARRSSGAPRTPRAARGGGFLSGFGNSFGGLTSGVQGFAIPPIAYVVIAAVIVLGAIGLYLHMRPVDITINGVEYTIGDSKDVKAAYAAALQDGLMVSPGNFVAVDGEVITQGQGKEYDAFVNDELVDENTRLHDGDRVVFGDGSDITEDYTSEEESVPATVTLDGIGAIHIIGGTNEPGILTTKTGVISGRTATEYTVEPANRPLIEFDAETNGEKVVALTFDDGPSVYTKQILDILAQYDAKATFFTIGQSIDEDDGASIVRAEAVAGHQVCTHTYTHCMNPDPDGDDGALGYLTPEQQVDEISRGLDAIRRALNKDDISLIFRAPSGYITESIMRNLQDLVVGEVAWNVDTMDWTLPGDDAIYNEIMKAQPGDIILCHDGGGERDQTVNAIRRAIPELQAQGYRFVTIDELIEIDRAARGESTEESGEAAS